MPSEAREVNPVGLFSAKNDWMFYASQLEQSPEDDRFQAPHGPPDDWPYDENLPLDPARGAHTWTRVRVAADNIYGLARFAFRYRNEHQNATTVGDVSIINLGLFVILTSSLARSNRVDRIRLPVLLEALPWYWENRPRLFPSSHGQAVLWHGQLSEMRIDLASAWISEYVYVLQGGRRA